MDFGALVHRPGTAVTTVPTVRRLLPGPPAEVDPLAWHAELDRPPPPERPHVLVNMVASVDGATTAADDVSGGLGTAGDRAMFSALRSVPDVILVAAGTANAERYRAPRATDAVQAARRARGQEPLPRLAVVTGRLSVDLTLEAFTEPGPVPPLVLTTATAPADRRAAVAEVAEVVDTGEDTVDLARALALLAERGARTVLCEGGPSLNGSLAALDLVDEWNLTVSPLLAGGDSRRIVSGAPAGAAALTLAHVLAEDDTLCLRYVRER